MLVAGPHLHENETFFVNAAVNNLGFENLLLDEMHKLSF